jgi:speckle-type POZ protein
MMSWCGIGLHGDVRFIVQGDELDFRAHRCILAARSPVFAAMFSNRMAEVSSSTDGITLVHIDDITRPVFEALLRFIYTVCYIITSLPDIHCDSYDT